jgi:hypothetical protein
VGEIREVQVAVETSVAEVPAMISNVNLTGYGDVAQSGRAAVLQVAR